MKEIPAAKTARRKESHNQNAEHGRTQKPRISRDSYFMVVTSLATAAASSCNKNSTLLGRNASASTSILLEAVISPTTVPVVLLIKRV